MDALPPRARDMRRAGSEMFKEVDAKADARQECRKGARLPRSFESTKADGGVGCDLNGSGWNGDSVRVYSFSKTTASDQAFFLPFASDGVYSKHV
jgi:hypothetical protein